VSSVTTPRADRLAPWSVASKRVTVGSYVRFGALLRAAVGRPGPVVVGLGSARCSRTHNVRVGLLIAGERTFNEEIGATKRGYLRELGIVCFEVEASRTAQLRSDRHWIDGLHCHRRLERRARLR
jgi:hypothetical protein